MSAIIKGAGILFGASTALQTAGAIAIIESAKFTPRYPGPVVEVEDSDGVVKAFALQTDGGDIALEAVYENNATTSNFGLLEVGDTIICKFPAINGGNNINCTVVSLPDVTLGKKAEMKISFKAIWRPGAVA